MSVTFRQPAPVLVALKNTRNTVCIDSKSGKPPVFSFHVTLDIMQYAETNEAAGKKMECQNSNSRLCGDRTE